MMRLFIALLPPLPIRRALLARMGGVPGARWQKDEQLHVTLRFLGEVDRHRAMDIAASLNGLRSVAIALEVAGTGAFVRRGRAHTLWAGVRGDPSLLSLQTSIERRMIRVGLPPDDRAFHPDVTLARGSIEQAAVEPWLACTAHLTIPPATIEHVLLYESVLGSEGACYQPIDRYPLG